VREVALVRRESFGGTVGPFDRVLKNENTRVTQDARARYLDRLWDAASPIE